MPRVLVLTPKNKNSEGPEGMLTYGIECDFTYIDVFYNIILSYYHFVRSSSLISSRYHEE